MPKFRQIKYLCILVCFNKDNCKQNISFLNGSYDSFKSLNCFEYNKGANLNDLFLMDKSDRLIFCSNNLKQCPVAMLNPYCTLTLSTMVSVIMTRVILAIFNSAKGIFASMCMLQQHEFLVTLSLLLSTRCQVALVTSFL